MSQIPDEPDSLVEEADVEPVEGEDYEARTPRPDLVGEASEHDVAEQARPVHDDDDGSDDEGSLGM